MPNYTPNYNLKKPLGTESYNVEDQNGNMDIIDAAIAAKETPAGAQTKATAAETAAKAYADAIVAALVASSPATLDTLNELAAALGDDPNFATTVLNQIAAKADASAFTTHTAESATTLVKGHVQLATSAETTTGTDTSKAVTPAGVKAVADTKLEVNYGNIVTKSASFTLALTEKNRVITMTGTAAQTITIPANTTVAFPVGTQITVLMQGTGTVTFAPASGVTLYSKDTKRIIDGQYASATLVKTAADTWCLIGALK